MKKITLLITLMISSLGFSQNLITNGDFENGTTGWSGNALSLVTENGNSYSSADVLAAGNGYDANLSYVLPMTIGKKYKLTFDAFSDRNRTLIAGIGLNQDPWTNTVQTVNLTATLQTFVLELTASFSSQTSRIIFDMGAATGFVGIDNVILEEVIDIPTDNSVLIEDFETLANFTFAGFEGLGSATIDTDPALGGTKLKGLKIVSSSIGNAWQGAEVVLKTSKIKLTTNKTVKIDVYSNTVFTLLGKVEAGNGPASATAASYTTPGVWQTLTFTFNQALDNSGIANGEYSKIAFFPNWNGNFGTPPTDFTVNIDNITAEKTTVVDPTPLTAAPTPPNRLPADVVSIYSDAYTSISPINTDAGWCGTGSVIATTAGSVDNNVFAYKGNNCQGITFPSDSRDLTGFTNIHVDFFIAAGTDLIGKVFNLKIVPTTGGGNDDVSINIDINGISPAPVPGTWYSYDRSFTANELLKITTSPIMHEFAVTSNLNNVVWYDNVYIHKGTTLGTAKFEKSNLKVYPNPATSNLTIEANSTIERVSIYNVLGQEVLSKSPKASNTILDISNLQKGTYIVRTTSEGTTETSKVLKK